MNRRILRIAALASLSLVPCVSQAQSLVEGSADAGKAKSVICAACHGQEGISVNPLWPNLAGQAAPYIVTQINAFKSGDRVDPLMSSQAMLLSGDDVANVAVYYEGLSAAAAAVANPATVARAEAIYRGGIEDKGVPACLACHGPTGRGNPAAGYPAINGQHAEYTAKQLRDYGSGARKSDGTTRVMRTIAERLSEDEISAIASYVQGLK